MDTEGEQRNQSELLQLMAHKKFDWAQRWVGAS
jgi:hypothetical protein